MKKHILMLLALVLMSTMLVLAVSAEVTVSYDLSVEETDDGAATVNVITATLVDATGVFGGYMNKISFDNTIIIPADYYDGSIVDLEANPDYCIEGASYTNRGKTYSATIVDPLWIVEGTRTTHSFDSLYVETTQIPTKNGLAVFKFYFVFADGKTADDFTSDSFVVEQAMYPNGDYNYYNVAGHDDNIVVTNNVVPEAPVVEAITVPVAAGDKVYLQNGSVAVVEAAGDYEVPATVGYVAVNTGYTAQKTYYVDGTSATLVHTNGVVAKDEYALRDPSQKYNGEDRSGLRFKMEHATAGRTVANHEIVEVGFIMTAESAKVLAAEGDDYVLDMAMVNRGWARSGYAYNTADGTDFAFNPSDDFNYIITGVFYNVPMSEVQTTIAARPYYKVGETYVYGEITKTSLYEVATAIKASENWGELSDEQQSYVNTIIAQVDGWTEIVEDEVIIDISDLYN